MGCVWMVNVLLCVLGSYKERYLDTVYFSMEEWKFTEGHKDLYKNTMTENQPPLTSPGGQYVENNLYKDVMMENLQSLTTPDGSRNTNTPERCPRPLYSQDYTQEDQKTLQTSSQYSWDSIHKHQEIPQTHPLYSRDSIQGHQQIPLTLPLYSQSSIQQHKEIPQTLPLYSRDSTQEHHEILQKGQDEMNKISGTETRDDPEEHYVRNNELRKGEKTEISTGGQYLGNNLYNDVLMENLQSLTSPDGSRSRNTPERCPRPLYSRDYTQEHQEIPQTHPLYSQDSIQEHYEIPQTRPLYSRDSVQKHQQIVHTHPLYSLDFIQKHQQIPLTNPPYSQDSIQKHVKFPLSHSLYSRDSTQKRQEILQKGQDEVNKISKTETRDPENPYVRGNELRKERDISLQISIGGQYTENNVYKDLMMEKRPPLTSADGSRNTPESCPLPLYSRDSIQKQQKIPQTYPPYSQDSTQEHQEIPQKDQDKINKISGTETRDDPEEHYMKSKKLCKEGDIPLQTGTGAQYIEINLYKDIIMENRPPVTSPDGSRNTPERCPRPVYSRDYTQEHQEIPQTHPLYSQHSIQKHQEIPQTCSPYSRDSNQKHQEIPQTYPLCSRDSTQEHQEIPQQDQDAVNVISGTQTGDNTEEPYVNSELCEDEDMPLQIGISGQYIENNVYQGVMMEKRPPLTSPDGSRNTPERCPRPLYSQDNTKKHQEIPQTHPFFSRDVIEEHHEISQQNQAMDQEHQEIPPKDQDGINIISGTETRDDPEEPYVKIDELRMEGKTPPAISTGGQYKKKNTENHPAIYSDCEMQNEDDITPDSTKGNPMTPNLHTAPYSSDPLTGPSTEMGLHSDSDYYSVAPRIDHGSPKSIPCPECGKCFSDRSKLATHQKSHSGDKPFTCMECGKSFKLSAYLVLHSRTHTTVRPYTCSKCGKGFFMKLNLIRHKKSHTWEKPFSCPVCGKGFSEKCKLIKHEKIHTAEAYSCAECGKHFSTKANLIAHLRTHNGEKQLSCTKRKKSISRRSVLKKHKKVKQAHRFLRETDDSDGDSTVSESGSDYQPYDNSDSMTSSADEREVVRATTRITRSKAAGTHKVQTSSKSAAPLLDVLARVAVSQGEMASASSEVQAGAVDSTNGDVQDDAVASTSSDVQGGAVASTSSDVQADAVASTSSNVQAGAVASTSRVTKPPPTKAHTRKTPRVPEMIAKPNWLPPDSAAPPMPPFIAKPGIQVETANLKTPLDFFELFFTKDLYRLIVKQTNLYAQQFITANPNNHLARPFFWKPIKVAEFKTFLGLTLLMGIIKKGELRSYWSTDPIHHMSVFSAAMTRTRYEMIMRFMHFNDNSRCRSRSDPEYDRLFKIRPLINFLSKRFSDLYTPQKNICVDESLIHFCGRLTFKQYIPNKRSRYGVKLYKLCERATGYTYKFRIYEGNDNEVDPPGCPGYLGSSARVAWDLVSSLFDKGYHLYVDNFFTSVPLFKSLYLRKICCCGTIRPNRQGFPQQLLNTPLKKGEKNCLRNEELLAMKWKDKRDVYMMSTIHSDRTVGIQTASGVVEKPLCIHEYNLYMGGVDFNDQRMKPYLVARKARRWYKKVSIYLFQLAIYNAFVLYKACRGTETFLKFQESIIKALLYPRGAVTPNTNPDAASRLHKRHFPDILPSTRTQRTPQRRCRVCSRHGMRRDTRTYCPDCPNQPGLCIKNCFRLFHTLVQY